MRGYIISICSFLLILFSIEGMDAQSIKQQRRKKAKLEKDIAMIDKRLSENATKSNAMLSNLTLVRKKIDNRRDLVKESDAQIRMLADSIYLKQKEINTLQARVDTLTAHYSRLVLSAYKNRDSKVWFMHIFSSSDLSQGYRRYAYFKNLSRQMNEEALQIRQMQAQLNEEKALLASMQEEAKTVKASRVKELSQLRIEEVQADNIVKALEKDRAKYQKQLDEKKKQVQALNKEIERLVQETMKKSTSSKKKTKPVDYKLADEFSSNKGKLPWPAEGPVVGSFGKQYHPVFTNLALPENKGIDVALAPNSDVKAVFNGEVVQVVVLPQYNQCVMIQHGNYLTVYCKLKAVSVRVGDSVRTGDVIGEVDTINGETELHFEVWKDNTPQNPVTWLR